MHELGIKSTKPLKGKLISQFIETRLSQFDPDTIARRISEVGLRSSQDIVFEDDDVKLVISLIPKSPKTRGKEGVRPIGIYPVISTWGGSSKSIKSAVQRKATRYGVLNKPYLVCINATSDKVTDEYEIMEALLGTLQLKISGGPDGVIETWVREYNGVFLSEFGPQYTRVCAVLVTDVYPTTIHLADHWLVNNPFATHPIDFSKLSLTTHIVADGQITLSRNRSIPEIIDLPPDWLTLE